MHLDVLFELVGSYIVPVQIQCAFVLQLPIFAPCLALLREWYLSAILGASQGLASSRAVTMRTLHYLSNHFARIAQASSIAQATMMMTVHRSVVVARTANCMVSYRKGPCQQHHQVSDPQVDMCGCSGANRHTAPQTAAGGAVKRQLQAVRTAASWAMNQTRTPATLSPTSSAYRVVRFHRESRSTP